MIINKQTQTIPRAGIRNAHQLLASLTWCWICSLSGSTLVNRNVMNLFRSLQRTLKHQQGFRAPERIKGSRSKLTPTTLVWPLCFVMVSFWLCFGSSVLLLCFLLLCFQFYCVLSSCFQFGHFFVAFCHCVLLYFVVFLVLLFFLLCFCFDIMFSVRFVVVLSTLGPQYKTFLNLILCDMYYVHY